MARTDCALAELALMDHQAQAALLQLSESRGHLLLAVQLRLVSYSGLGCSVTALQRDTVAA